ncbi:hypothetical protein [uncultured Tenacibaculum sp.]|uniref:hypothetical protein n=1 Tax=uncultured Tenacibaculum sp. TaxID=174713 RepID=UPI0026339BE0|nr:hypothetical protein [uncultured Tenacibaculum sp.]
MKTCIKLILPFLIIIVFSSCTRTQMIEYWKNPEVDTLSLSKVLVIGMTPNVEARDKFEELLTNEFEARGIDAVPSLDIFEPKFRIEGKTEKELKVIEDVLTANYYDAVIYTKVVGVENRRVFSEKYKEKKYLDIKFKDEYYNHREILENPNYYEEYKIYNAETSLYCICPTKDRELIWKGYIDIVDPKSIEETVNDYVNLLILALEEQQIISKIKQKE